MTAVDLRQHKADYGYDGDYRAVSAQTVATIVGTVSAGLLASAARSLVRGKPAAAAVTGGTAAFLVTTAATFIRATRVGKFEVWAEILEGLRLRGDETVLDLGCGRGAVLLATAKLLPDGRAIGVDIWRADQTDNSQQNTLRNAELEGVADRVEVRTADITDLPYEDNSVDVIVSSLVVHNIESSAARAQAISEAARVLRPGGRLVLADIWATGHHVRQLRGLGWTDARRRNLGWRMWWGPGMGTHLITATKPAQAAVGGTAGTD
ncbi:MAG TPA: methyltransferase domain-containing protein [Mycobacterium sp.]|jgi:SAM-dependent methyltransferase|nr:methyltransferase domain-containing protein [Mycobacterium sp.]